MSRRSCSGITGVGIAVVLAFSVPGFAQVPVAAPAAPAAATAAQPLPEAIGGAGGPAGPVPVGQQGFTVSNPSLLANEAFTALRAKDFARAIELYDQASKWPGGQEYGKMITRVRELQQEWQEYQAFLSQAQQLKLGEDVIKQRESPLSKAIPENANVQQGYWLGWKMDPSPSDEQKRDDLMKFLGYTQRESHDVKVEEFYKGAGVSGGRHVISRTRQRLSSSMPGYTDLEATNAMNSLP